MRVAAQGRRTTTRRSCHCWAGLLSLLPLPLRASRRSTRPMQPRWRRGAAVVVSVSFCLLLSIEFHFQCFSSLSSLSTLHCLDALPIIRVLKRTPYLQVRRSRSLRFQTAPVRPSGGGSGGAWSSLPTARASSEPSWSGCAAGASAGCAAAARAGMSFALCNSMT